MAPRAMGRLLTLLKNIRECRKKIPRTNVLAYFAGAEVTKKKGFMALTPD
jgi:hypothetical protein